MNSNFLENFYGTLFTPDKTFDEMKNSPNPVHGIFIVVFVSILNLLLNFKPVSSGYLWLTLGIFYSAFSGIFSWLFFALFLELIAKIFKQSGKFHSFLMLSAFALLPWIFLAPVELLKTGSGFENFIAVIFGLAIWLWTTVLMFTAVIKTYNLSFSRTLAFFAVPFAGFVLAFNWIIGFFATLGNILDI